jgi:hypothetical protein
MMIIVIAQMAINPIAAASTSPRFQPRRRRGSAPGDGGGTGPPGGIGATAAGAGCPDAGAPDMGGAEIGCPGAGAPDVGGIDAAPGALHHASGLPPGACSTMRPA